MKDTIGLLLVLIPFLIITYTIYSKITDAIVSLFPITIAMLYTLVKLVEYVEKTTIEQCQEAFRAEKEREKEKEKKEKP